MTQQALSFPDHNQNFWQLACIVGAAQSIPNFLIGRVLVNKCGTIAALSSICVGNLLLWLVGLGIISMAASGRKNVVQITKEYLGGWGSIFVAIVLTLGFTFWYVIELQSAERVMKSCLPFNWTGEHVGFVLGMITAALALGGIRLIKTVCVWSLPVLFVIILLGLFFYGHIPASGGPFFSFAGIVIITMLGLPYFVNLSTFFRHSHSKADSILALSLGTLFDMFVQIPTIFIDISSPEHIFISSSALFIGMMFLFILVSLLCVNLVIIYFASVCVELIVPRLHNMWGCFWMGIIGTLVFVFFRHSPTMGFLEVWTSNCVVSLGTVLLLAFLVHAMTGKRAQRGEKLSYLVCWIIGCINSLLTQLQQPQDESVFFLNSIWVPAIAFLSFFFIRKFGAVSKEINDPFMLVD